MNPSPEKIISVCTETADWQIQCEGFAKERKIFEIIGFNLSDMPFADGLRAAFKYDLNIHQDKAVFTPQTAVV